MLLSHLLIIGTNTSQKQWKEGRAICHGPRCEVHPFLVGKTWQQEIAVGFLISQGSGSRELIRKQTQTTAPKVSTHQ